MIHGMTLGDYAYADSSEFVEWSDLDDTPVPGRSYAYTLFKFEDSAFLRSNIYDELDDYFGTVGWHADPEDSSIAVANGTVSAWPFVVRRKVKVFTKYHDGVNGWVEKPYDLNDITSLMEAAVEPKVWYDVNNCD